MTYDELEDRVTELEIALRLLTKSVTTILETVKIMIETSKVR